VNGCLSHSYKYCTIQGVRVHASAALRPLTSTMRATGLKHHMLYSEYILHPRLYHGKRHLVRSFSANDVPNYYPALDLTPRWASRTFPAPTSPLP